MFSVVAKELGSWLKIKLRWLKEGAKRLVLSVVVPVVLYQAITGQKSEFRRQPAVIKRQHCMLLLKNNHFFVPKQIVESPVISLFYNLLYPTTPLL